MKMKSLIGAVAGVMLSPAAFAGTFNLSLTAEDGARWYEYFSGAYAELGSDWGIIDNEFSEDFGEPADGFYAIESGGKIGGGAIVFPFENNFLNVGSLSFDDTTGAINSLTLDFDNFVADDDSISNIGYATSVSSVEGFVSLAGAGVSAIDLQAEIVFTYDSNFGPLAYTGTFAIDGDAFDLFVDDTNTVAPYDFRYVWDVEGTVQNLTPVPEASTYAMLLAGLGVVGGLARRRRRA